MKHDLKLVKETTDRELLALGQDRIVYITRLSTDAIASLNLVPPLASGNVEIWGVYSANGDLVAACDSPDAAWEYTTDKDLVAVRTH